MIMPQRYVEHYKDIYVLLVEGQRPVWGRRWVCRRCGKQLKPNTAGAQAHLVTHITTPTPPAPEGT